AEEEGPRIRLLAEREAGEGERVSYPGGEPEQGESLARHGMALAWHGILTHSVAVRLPHTPHFDSSFFHVLIAVLQRETLSIIHT
ncbi:hypothetical protein CH063_15222, partial [Colletotrichum higginsianum]